jgi:hypothetical protein
MKNDYSRRKFIKMSALGGSLMMANPWLRFHPGSNPTTDDTHLDMGLLDITKAPYNADPKGKKDSTAAIQSAVNDARDNKLVCFFPTGTYLISDTISCEQRVQKLDKPRYTDSMRQSWWDSSRDTIYMLGSTKGPRPVLKLAKNAKGFDDPKKPKYAVKIWAQTRNDYMGQHEPLWGLEQPNISFSHIYRGIDLDIREHAGAIGLRHSGSQGTSLMDCKVLAEGAFAGFSNCPGQGGGTYNLEVSGGKYGIYADPDYRFPMLAACIFKGQEIAPVYYKTSNLPMVLVGCYIESESNIAVDLSDINSFTGLSMIDCIVKTKKPGSLVNTNLPQNVFLENVFIKGCENLQTHDQEVIDPGSWTKVNLYSFCENSSRNLINGTISGEAFYDLSVVENPPSPEEIHKKHWRRLPSFEDDDVINIKDLGAKGDGNTDDTGAFEKAFDNYRKIYVPRGSYKISKTLNMKPDTELFGIWRSYLEMPSLATFDNINDRSLISFIHIDGELTWGSGQGSFAFANATVNLTPNAGGRFYALRRIGARGENRLFEGTKQPIFIYTLNVERRKTNPQAYIKNSENIKIFYFKTEASPTGWNISGGENLGNTSLAIIDSKNIKIYCSTGNVLTSDSRPMIKVENSEEIVISQIKSFKTADFAHVHEDYNGKTSEIPSGTTVALFARTN